jgi:hypothetical protein
MIDDEDSQRELRKEISGLRKDVGALKQDGEYARDTNTAIGKQMDQAVKDIALLKREAELEKKLAVQRAQRRIENLEVALIAKGRSPYEHDDDADGEIPKME